MAERSRDERIREKAYELWVAEGQPHGRDEAHWEQAREIVATQDSQRATLLPRTAGAGEPDEPAAAFENQGEFPTLTDQGDSERGPSRRATRRTSRSSVNPGESVATSLPKEPPAAKGAKPEGTVKAAKAGAGRSGASKGDATRAGASKAAAPKAGTSKSASSNAGGSNTSATVGLVAGAEGQPDRPKRGRPPKMPASDVRH